MDGDWACGCSDWEHGGFAVLLVYEDGSKETVLGLSEEDLPGWEEGAGMKVVELRDASMEDIIECDALGTNSACSLDDAFLYLSPEEKKKVKVEDRRHFAVASLEKGKLLGVAIENLEDARASCADDQGFEVRYASWSDIRTCQAMGFSAVEEGEEEEFMHPSEFRPRKGQVK